MLNFLMNRCSNNLYSKKLLGFIIASMFIFNFSMAQDACEMDTNSIQLQSDGAVWYNVDTDIGGFQFNIDGGATISGASGGDAAAAGFVVQGAGTTVLGFSFTGSTISASCGTLTNLTLSGESTGLSGGCETGDINCDAIVNILDVVLLVNIIMDVENQNENELMKPF